MVTKVRRSVVLPKICESFRLSQRRVCRILALNRSILHYRSVKCGEPALRAGIVEIANVRIKYGYNRITSRLRLEGWRVNRKRVYRIYREEGLVLRRKTPKRRRAAVVREDRVTPTASPSSEVLVM
jgi:putative transposase